MAKGKAFVIVGHSQWGKSYTLNALTEKYGGGWHKRSVTIHDTQAKIPVKKMSNDDEPRANLLGFIKEQACSRTQTIILPFCPNFYDGRGEETEKLLKALGKSYEIFFMVLKMAQGDGDTKGIIDDREIAKLRKRGMVEIINGKHDKHARAKRFKGFIERFL